MLLLADKIEGEPERNDDAQRDRHRDQAAIMRQICAVERRMFADLFITASIADLLPLSPLVQPAAEDILQAGWVLTMPSTTAL